MTSLPALTPRAVSAYWQELEKIGFSKEHKNEAALAAVGAGSAGALVLSRPGVYTEHIPNTNKVTLYYSDPRRGAGHMAQAQALADSLRKQGADVKMVNFDMEFVKRAPHEMERDPKTGEHKVTPKALADYNDSYSQWAANPEKEGLHVEAHHHFYGKNIDRAKVQASFDEEGRKVLTNVGLQIRANDTGKPSFLLHTDQHPWEFNDFGVPGKGHINRHIAAKSTSNVLLEKNPGLRDRLHVISDLPIKPPNMSETRPFREPGKVNITVSGGNLGVSTPEMVQELLDSGKLPKGTVIHAVAGKQPGVQATTTPGEANSVAAKIRAFFRSHAPGGHGVTGAKTDNLRRLEELEHKTRGGHVQVRAYGFAPLPSMMRHADVNVLRPHGTSITEATAAGKPFSLYLPPDGARDMDRGNVRAMAKHLGIPVGTHYRGSGMEGAHVDTLGNHVHGILNDPEKALHKRVAAAAGTAGTGAEQAALDILHTSHFVGRAREGAGMETLRAARNAVAKHGLSTDLIRTGLSSAGKTGAGWSLARGALAAGAAGTTGVLAHRIYKGTEHKKHHIEKVGEERKDHTGLAVGAATGAAAAAATVPATRVADSFIREDVEKKGPAGSLQKLTKTEGDLTDKALNTLSDEQILHLQKDHVLQWLVSDHDAHKHNVMRLPSGHLFSIDKGNALRMIGQDRPTLDYKASKANPYLQSQLKKYVKGDYKDLDVKGPRRNADLSGFIKKLQDIPDEQFLGHFSKYFDAARKEGFPQGYSEDQFRTLILKRKANLHNDMHTFYDEVEGKRAAAVGKDFKPAARSVTAPKGEVPKELLESQKLPWAAKDLKPSLVGHIGGSRSHPKSVLNAPDGSKWLFKESPVAEELKGGARVATAEKGVSDLAHAVGHPSATVHDVHFKVPFRTSLPQKVLLGAGVGAGAGIAGKYLYDKMRGGQGVEKTQSQRVLSYIEKLADEDTTNAALGAGAVAAGAAVPAMKYGDRIVRKGKDGKGQYGSLQKLTKNEGGVGEAALHDLTDAQITHLQKEHALSWLTSDWDSHKENVLKLPGGHLLGIDKGNAFRYFGKDKLEIGHLPVKMPWKPYFHEQLRHYSEGASPGVHIKGPRDNPELHGFLEKLHTIPDEEYKQILSPYADEADKAGKLKEMGGKEEFIRKALERKANLHTDVGRFYDSVKQARDRTPAARAPARAATQAPTEARPRVFRGKAPDVDKFKATDAKLGGKHPKLVLKGENGKWMFKSDPRPTVEAERAASLIANKVEHPSAEVHALRLDQPFRTPAAAKYVATAGAAGLTGVLAARMWRQHKEQQPLSKTAVASYWAEMSSLRPA